MIKDRKKTPTDEAFTKQHLMLLILGASSCILYLAIQRQSHLFAFGESFIRRPIPAVLGLFFVAFILYAVAIWLAKKIPNGKALVHVVFGVAIAFRIILLFSEPIQEVDIYRYLWDGKVATQGTSPFKYSPESVKIAIESGSSERDLESLAKLCRDDPQLKLVVERVHFGHLPTIYPATSQIVFALSAWTTPPRAKLTTRLRIMKAWLLAFDLATLFLVIKMLSLCRLPVGLSVAYGWCPIVIKEVANSGHLDSIAVFLTTLAVFMLMVVVHKTRAKEQREINISIWLIATAAVLAFAVGAKIYPIVLVPLMFFAGLKYVGWKSTFASAAVFTLLIAVLFYPMLPNSKAPGVPTPVANEPVEVPFSNDTLADSDPSKGLSTFFKYWEMNDFLFMVVVENLKPADQFPENRNVWFSVLPQKPRQMACDVAVNLFRIKEEERNTAPFLLTRAQTSLLFFILAMGLAAISIRSGDLKSIGTFAFLTLSWFWLLSPTQNPWYWLWALPFLPFMRNSAWYAVSGMIFLYYTRFWFEYHMPDQEVLGTGYQGTAFFDFVVVWLEFFPWLIWLIAEGAIRLLRQRRQNRHPLPAVMP